MATYNSHGFSQLHSISSICVLSQHDMLLLSHSSKLKGVSYPLIPICLSTITYNVLAAFNMFSDFTRCIPTMSTFCSYHIRCFYIFSYKKNIISRTIRSIWQIITNMLSFSESIGAQIYNNILMKPYFAHR